LKQIITLNLIRAVSSVQTETEGGTLGYTETRVFLLCSHWTRVQNMYSGLHMYFPKPLFATLYTWLFLTFFYSRYGKGKAVPVL